MISEKDIANINKKLEAITLLCGQLKVDTTEIRERLDELAPKSENSQRFPIDLPIKTLAHFEQLEEFVRTNEEQKRTFVSNKTFYF